MCKTRPVSLHSVQTLKMNLIRGEVDEDSPNGGLRRITSAVSEPSECSAAQPIIGLRVSSTASPKNDKRVALSFDALSGRKMHYEENAVSTSSAESKRIPRHSRTQRQDGG